MRTLALTTAKAQFSEIVDAAERTHEEFQITKNGSVAAVLVGIEEWESLQETLYWLAQPGIHEDIAQARAGTAAADAMTEDQIRERYSARLRSAR